MSTVIADAYRINDINGENIQVVNDKIKKFIKEENINIIQEDLVNELIKFRLYQAEVKNKELTFWEYLNFNSIFGSSREYEKFKTLLSYEHSSNTFYQNYFRMIELASELNLDVHFNKRSGFGFKFYNGHTYYIILGNHVVKSRVKKRYRSIAGKDFKLYEYWNNTDRPSHISLKDWNERSDNWDHIVNYYPSQDMNTVNIVPNGMDNLDYNVLYNLIPNDFEILQLLYKELRYNDFFVMEIERQIAAGESKSNSKANNFAKENISKGLNSGDILSMIELAKEYRLQKDMIAQDIFSNLFDFSNIKLKEV